MTHTQSPPADIIAMMAEQGFAYNGVGFVKSVVKSIKPFASPNRFAQEDFVPPSAPVEVKVEGSAQGLSFFPEDAPLPHRVGAYMPTIGASSAQMGSAGGMAYSHRIEYDHPHIED